MTREPALVNDSLTMRSPRGAMRRVAPEGRPGGEEADEGEDGGADERDGVEPELAPTAARCANRQSSAKTPRMRVNAT